MVLDRDYQKFISRNYGSWGIFVDVEGKIGSTLISSQGSEARITKIPDTIAFVKTDSVVPEEGGFAAELLYSGITGDTLRLSYREYANDFARPAYSQDLTYNLKESNIVTFRSLKIKIYRADNNEIEFSVEDDGDLPWVPRGRKLSVVG